MLLVNAEASVAVPFTVTLKDELGVGVFDLFHAMTLVLDARPRRV